MRCPVYPAGKNVSTSVGRPGPTAGRHARGGSGHAGGWEARALAHDWRAGGPADSFGDADEHDATVGGRKGGGTGAERDAEPVARAWADLLSTDAAAGGGGGGRGTPAHMVGRGVAASGITGGDESEDLAAIAAEDDGGGGGGRLALTRPCEADTAGESAS